MSTEATVNVGFICQSCNAPITVDRDFSRLDDITRAELLLPVFKGEKFQIKDSFKFDKVILPIEADASTNTLGFSVIDDIKDQEVALPIEIFSSLVDLMSEDSEIDHPLCEECANILIDVTSTDLKALEVELRLFKDFAKQVQNTPSSNTSALEEELRKLTEENSRLIEELRKVDEECREATVKIKHAQQEKLKLDEEEDKYWFSYCTYKVKLDARDIADQSYTNQLAAMQTELDTLKQKNIFNTAFPIWATKHIGRINNLRLGRLPTVPVEWNEINAAWGQTALLLWSLCGKLDIQFSKYRIVPFGNNSYIEEIKTGKNLPLYGSSGLKGLFDHKFDAAMVAFLDCMNEFQHYVESKNPHGGRKKFRMPYRICDHRIFSEEEKEGYSIKLQFNNDENWSKALKFLLTDLKWAVAYVSSSASEKNLNKCQ